MVMPGHEPCSARSLNFGAINIFWHFGFLLYIFCIRLIGVTKSTEHPVDESTVEGKKLKQYQRGGAANPPR